MMREYLRSSQHPSEVLQQARTSLAALLALLLVGSALVEFEPGDASHTHAHGSTHAIQGGGWVLELGDHGPHRSPQLETAALHRHEQCAVCINQLQTIGTSELAKATESPFGTRKGPLFHAESPAQSLSTRLQEARAPPHV